jgi:hypothetical protein
MDPATHDLFGNFVDGWYWQLAEGDFQKRAEFFQSVGNRQAAAICKRLAATTDDVLAQLIAESQGIWNEHWDGMGDGYSLPEVIEDAMFAQIGQGSFNPVNATEFVVEFICRITGTRAS